MSTATVNSVDLDKIAADYKKAYQNVKRRIIICGGTGCVANGSLDVRDALAKELEKAGIDVILEVKAEDRKKEDTYISKSGCQGFCQMGPLLHIEPGDILYTKVKIADVSNARSSAAKSSTGCSTSTTRTATATARATPKSRSTTARSAWFSRTAGSSRATSANTLRAAVISAPARRFSK